MRMKSLFAALVTSLFLAGGVAHAGQQQMPEFDQVDQDGDGTITQEEAQMYPEIQQEMEQKGKDELSEDDYEEMKEKQQ